MGIEPTGRTVDVRPDGFEDRGHHQVCEHFHPIFLGVFALFTACCVQLYPISHPLVHHIFRGCTRKTGRCSEPAGKAARVPVERTNTHGSYLHRPRLERYDLESDPHEENNLAADPAHAVILDALKAKLKTLRSRPRTHGS